MLLKNHNQCYYTLNPFEIQVFFKKSNARYQRSVRFSVEKLEMWYFLVEKELFWSESAAFFGLNRQIFHAIMKKSLFT